MENPNHIIKITERVLVPKNEWLRLLAIPVVAFFVIIIIGTWIFKVNLWDALHWGVKVPMLFATIAISMGSGYKKSSAPLEMQFYDDYLVIHRPKHYYDKNLLLAEFYTLFYKDIENCIFDARLRSVKFYGKMTAKYFRYKQDVSLPVEPVSVKNDSYFCFKSESPLTNDFVDEFELYSSIKVFVSGN